MAKVCAGCCKEIAVRQYLSCAFCKDMYDLECANVSIQRYLNTMTQAHKKSWKCQACICKSPKEARSDSTPIRLGDQDSSEQLKIIRQDNNYITIRKKNTLLNDTLDSEECSMLGNTICTDTPDPMKTSTRTDFTLDTLSELIISRLKENNKSIISDLQNTIQIEINKAIQKLKYEIQQQTNGLYKQNDQIRNDLEKVNAEIETLKGENLRLNNEIRELEMRITSNGIHYEQDISKKIVIYGFDEYHNEPENDLHFRLVQMFHELYNIDLTGYIEDTKRIGKYTNQFNNTRPLIMELISKKMVKYITRNSHYCHGTRISISEYLNKTAQRDRKILREQMFTARRSGYHAVIRDNKLYIDGKIHKIQDNADNTHNKSYGPANVNESGNTFRKQTPM